MSKIHSYLAYSFTRLVGGGLFFLLAALAMNLLGSSLYALIEKRINPWRILCGSLAFLCLLVILLAAFEIWMWPRFKRWLGALLLPGRQVGLVDQAADLPRKALVLTLSVKSSESTSAQRYVIEKLKPAYLGLIGTEETRMAEASLRASFHLDQENSRTVIVHPEDLVEIRHRSGELLDWLTEELRLDRAAICLDLTGGTAIMALGAFLAAEQRQIDTSYVKVQWKDKQPVSGSHRLLLPTHYPTR